MIKIIDTYLNKITMYRLTLYYLLVLLGIATIFSFVGLLSYNPLDILINAMVAIFCCYLSNKFFAQIVGAVTNNESALITALILVLIIPVAFPQNILFLAIACIVAMASKYLATINKQHVFNPAAVAVLAISFLSNTSATWWIGTPVMLPVVILGGILLIRKIQRGRMVITYFLTYFFVTAFSRFLLGGVASVVTVWKAGIFDSALFFFGFVMLTEPLTSPAREKLRNYYAALVAILFASPSLRLFSIALTPEIALCIGNIFSYIVSPKYRFILPFVKSDFFSTVGVFSFTLPSPISFIPGQYMEWTLPHENTDSRGNRRYFSIASSPTEKDLLLAIKFYNPSSSYKKRLKNLQENETIIAASLEGDFVLPKDLTKSLVFIAGGVGIAPFRSMIKYIIDKKLHANICLLYTNRLKEEIVFQKEFKDAEKYGVKTCYILTDTAAAPKNWSGYTGHLTPDIIKNEVNEYEKSIFYLSGPQLMVESYAEMLTKMHIQRSHIKQDFFPGYAET